MKGCLDTDNLTAYSLILRNSSIRHDSEEYRFIKKTIQSLEYHCTRFKRLATEEYIPSKNRYADNIRDAILDFYNVQRKKFTKLSLKESAYQVSLGLEIILSEIHQAEEERKQGTLQHKRAESLIDFFRILSAQS